MEFSCAKKDLLYVLQILGKAVSSKPKMPVLSGIYLKAEGGILHMEATDFEIGFITTIPATITTPGKVVLSGRFLQEMVRKLPSETVYFTQKENVTLIRGGKTEFSLLSMDSEDFPGVKLMDGKLELVMNEGALHNLIKKTVFSCSTDETRPVFCGCLLEIAENVVTMAATNTHRLSIIKETFPESIGNVKAIIPAKTLTELMHILTPEDPKDVRISISDNHVSFSLRNIYFTSRLIEGNYPDYQKVVPKGFSLRVVLKVEDLSDAIDRLSLISRAGEYNTINMLFEGDELRMYTNTPDIGRAEEAIPASIEGESLAISFNAAYISDVLKNLDTEKCVISLNRSLDPAAIREDGGEAFIYIVTPVRTGT